MIDKEKEFTIANIVISPKTDEISCDGNTIEIKSMAMKLICFFAEHHEQVVSRDYLRESLWKGSNPTDHTINNHIYNLRKIFATFDNETKFFHTVTGSQSGYRLIASVKQNLAKVIGEETIASTESSTDIDDEYKDVKSHQAVNTIEELIIPSSDKLLSSKKLIVLGGILLLALITCWLLINKQASYDNISALTSKSGREQNPSISEDGSILLYANRTSRSSTWELYAARLSSSSELVAENKVFNVKSNNDNFVSISPNKKYIAFIRYPKDERGVYLADFDEHSLTATNERLIIPLKTMNLSPIISWLNDTEFFYNATEAISAPRKIFKYDLIKNNSEPITAPPLDTYGDFAAIVSPNNKWLAVMRSDESYGYQLFLYDLDQKLLLPTPVKNDEERLRVSFSDDSELIYFVSQHGDLSSYHINDKEIDVISPLSYPGYWPLKIPGKSQFIIQQDWGLSSLTNRIIKINNPQTGGDGNQEVVVDNGLSTRSITGIANNGLIFASITANQQVELWKYQEGKAVKLNAFNNKPKYKSSLSLDWLKGSDKVLLSIDNSCHLIDIKTGQDSPLCPANETLYAGRFSKNGQSIYLATDDLNNSGTVEMGLSGYPLTPIPDMNAANSIHEAETGNFYYSSEPSFDIYHFNKKTGENKKVIERTFIIERFSNNDFTVTKDGIYFMDRKKIRQNAIYYYNFKNKKTNYVVGSKDNYPGFVLSDDEKFIYLIQSYDNDSRLSLIQ